MALHDGIMASAPLACELTLDGGVSPAMLQEAIHGPVDIFDEALVILGRGVVVQASDARHERRDEPHGGRKMLLLIMRRMARRQSPGRAVLSGVHSQSSTRTDSAVQESKLSVSALSVYPKALFAVSKRVRRSLMCLQEDKQKNQHCATTNYKERISKRPVRL